MLYRGKIDICSQIDTKHINSLCGQNVELLSLKQAVHIERFESLIYITRKFSPYR